MKIGKSFAFNEMLCMFGGVAQSLATILKRVFARGGRDFFPSGRQNI